LEKIPKNRNRSNNGTDESPASCKTRALNDNQLFYFKSLGKTIFLV
jgi:hypothetical protein